MDLALALQVELKNLVPEHLHPLCDKVYENYCSIEPFDGINECKQAKLQAMETALDEVVEMTYSAIKSGASKEVLQFGIKAQARIIYAMVRLLEDTKGLES